MFIWFCKSRRQWQASIKINQYKNEKKAQNILNLLILMEIFDRKNEQHVQRLLNRTNVLGAKKNQQIEHWSPRMHAFGRP